MARSRPLISLPVVAEQPEVPLYTGHLTGKLEAHLRIVSRNRTADLITGGLSKPGKMPCPSWGIPAKRCRVGSELAKIAGTVCHDCYALVRNYKRQTVQDKLEERYEGLFHELWTPAMIFLVNYFCDEYFRLFDSGDLQGEAMYKNIITLARFVPEVKIWMPSREIQTISSVHRELIQAGIEFPKNLIPRISTNMIDGKPVKGFPYTSTVVSDPESASCIAQRQKNKCDGEIDNCRACWNDAHVSYPLH